MVRFLPSLLPLLPLVVVAELTRGSSGPATTFPESKAALFGVYETLGGPGGTWVNSRGWTLDKKGDPCRDEWHGVTCSREGYVIRLELPSNGLRAGSVKDWQRAWKHIGELEDLRVLDLSGNADLGGAGVSIPETALEGLGKTIEHIDLSRANLGGHLPDDFHAMESLRYLNLSRNAFRGPLPDGLWAATALETLDISHNGLHGRVPVALQHLDRLTLLDLSHNRLGPSLPRTLCRLRSLAHLDASHNEITVVPEDLSKCPSLQTLRLSHNGLAGEPPRLVAEDENANRNAASDDRVPNNNNNNNDGNRARKRPSRLLEVDLSHNEFSGPLPVDVVSAASVVQRIDLGNNLFSSRIPEEQYGRADQRGVKVNLAGNPFDCPVPDWARDRMGARCRGVHDEL